MGKLIGTIAIAVVIVILSNFSISTNSDDTGFISPPTANAHSKQNTESQIWKDKDASSITPLGERIIVPQNFRTISLNSGMLMDILYRAPDESLVKAKNSNIILNLPLPDGTFGSFKIVESPVMAPELAAKFPGIKTYLGQGITDRTATVRFDVTQFGFHAMILSAGNTVFIDPYSRNDVVNYISYYKSDFRSSVNKEFICHTEADEKIGITNFDNSPDAIGDELRTYRLALACTGEYAIYHGGTVPGAMAAMVTSMNRVNGVYENDFSVRMVLIANNNLLIYTNPGTDPYTNNNGGAMLTQNQNNIDAVIGSPNYDVGHVFSTGGGGVASLRSVCSGTRKAMGVTGSFAPVGDPFDIDYVAHEMGHQFGGNHTQNNNCNRASSSAYEPGSASTIMGYAGICPPNLQNNSDPYFNTHNFDEIVSHITGAGGVCAVTTATGNTAPTVNAGTGGFTIPIRTPFTLTGSATDPDNDTLTYCWEQHDLGPSGHPNNPSGNAPIFRSFNPVTSPSRTFPKWSNVLNNNQTLGEILPTYTRGLSFRLTVRDNNAGAGGSAHDEIAFDVTNTAGPFLVTFPDTSTVQLEENASYNITWDVANTNTAPVNCANVNILLSTDGGSSFPTTLKSNTPNDGSESVTIPSGTTAMARIMVQAADNIFFDVSNYNFSIVTQVSVNQISSIIPDKFELRQNYPNPFNPATKIEFAIPQRSNVSIKVYDIAGSLVRTIVSNSIMIPGTYSTQFDGANLSSGIYYYRIESESFTQTKKMVLIK